MQVLYLGRAPCTKETLPDFLKWRRVTRPPLVFRGLTGSQRTPGFWGVTCDVTKVTYNMYSCYTRCMSREMMEMDGRDSAKCRKSKAWGYDGYY